MKKKYYSKLFAVAIYMLFCVCYAATEGAIYVDGSATGGGNNGGSWTNAYLYLQDAIAAASAGDQIWIADGIYTPDKSNASPTGTGDREASFVLKNLVEIQGGFAGTETSLEQRVDGNETFLSGDLLGNDEAATATADLLTDTTRDDNSYHVIVGQYCGPLTLLDGLTITAGHANGADELGKGGGWYNATNSSPTVTNCIFIKNAAAINGGGLYNKGIASRPPITDCQFRDNLSGTHGGGISCESNSLDWVISNCEFLGNVASSYGGGMYFVFGSPTVEDCKFMQNKAHSGGGLFTNVECHIVLKRCELEGNIATSRGGGIYNSVNNTTVEECEFISNRADEGGAMFNSSNASNISDTLFWYNVSVHNGGAIDNHYSSPIFTNCKFLANDTEAGHGGAILNTQESNPKSYNCIFSFNKAIVGSGGAIFNEATSGTYPDPEFFNCSFSWNSAAGNGGGIYSNHGYNDIYLTNCILWDNIDTNGSKQDLNAQIWGGTYHVTNSCIKGYDTSIGVGNINTDPMFVNPAGEDFKHGTLDDDLHLADGSPCIDAGNGLLVPDDILTDIDGLARCQDDLPTPDTGIPAVNPPHDPNGVPDMGAYEFGDGEPYPVWRDDNLKAAVEETLGITNPTCSDMLNLTSLDIQNKEITCLGGLERALNLTYLRANNNQIVDLTPIAGCTKLQTLYLYSNDIVDISPLCNLVNLTYLHLAYNEIEEIPSCLCNLTKIQNLYLYSNNISDLCPTTCFTTLRVFQIYNIETLSLNAYQVCIPQIKANNPNLTDFKYDSGCLTMLKADVNGDCIVNLVDLAQMASEWLSCTHMYSEMCQ